MFILSLTIAFVAISVLPTAPAPILALVTASSAMLVVPTAPVPIFAFVTELCRMASSSSA